jgi:predicted amidohydrolase YtcJ
MGHINYWGETFSEYVLGPERAARIHPLQSDIDAGLIISLHSDAPVVEVDPLMYVRTAVMREMYPSNEVLGGGERISLLEAIKAVTINVAKTIGVEETTGSLEVGKKADFIILDKDPRSLESTDLRLLTSLEIQQTWLEGQKTWSL